MPIARIIMGEQHSPEAQDQLLEDHRHACVSGFLKTADFSIAVRTGETSFMITTVYETAEIADANKEARTKWMEERTHLIREDFYYEGEVSTLIKGGGGPLLSKYPAKFD
jgi:hypothetical protein